MSINQISNANTFGQLITAVSAMIAVANNLTDGPQVVTNAAWTFSNPGVGVNVGNTALIGTANVSILNTSVANLTNETVGTSNISTANITVANVGGATIGNINSTQVTTTNANVSGLLQVSDRANVFSLNAQSANITSLALTTLAVSELTVPVLNTSFANITSGLAATFQATSLIAVLSTSTNANIGLLNASTANITGETVGTSNISVANVTLLNVGTLNLSTANITGQTVGVSNVSQANMTSANIVSMNVSTVNVSNLTAVTLNASFANLTVGSVMSANPTINLGIATKNYVDTGAGANLVNKLSFNAKGDIILGTGANTYAALNTGTNGQVVIVDTNQTTGMRFSDRPTQSFRGLTLCTSMADKIANGTQLTVYRCDEVVMDDGEVVTGWTVPATINMATTGAGGLDGGTANANTWYEVYAIRNRTDGSKNFIIHRALDRLPNQNTFNASFYPIQAGAAAGLGANNTSNLYIKLAQSFTPNVSGPLTSLEIRAFRTSTPTGNMWLTIEANSAGSPSGTTLTTSRKMDVARLPLTNPANVRFVFDNTANVTAGTSYFWIFNSDYAGSATAFINVTYSLANTDIGANGVNRGLPYGNTGAAWAALNPGIGTFIYKTYIESNSNAVTMPTGYDQKCLISYIATDSSSKIKEFSQRDRVIMPYPTAQWANFTLQIANPEVIDLGVYAGIPPITCMVSFFATGTSLNTYGVGRLHALDLPSAASTTDIPGGATIGQISFGTTASSSPPVMVEQQAILIKSGLAAFKLFPASITF